MKRLLLLAPALALVGCAYAPPKSGMTAGLNVTNATDHSWTLYIDGRRAGKIKPQQKLPFRVASGVHRVRALDRFYTIVYNRKRIAEKAFNLGQLYSPNQKVEFVIAHYATRWDVLLAFRSASGGGPRPVAEPTHHYPPVPHPQ